MKVPSKKCEKVECLYVKIGGHLMALSVLRIVTYPIALLLPYLPYRSEERVHFLR